MGIVVLVGAKLSGMPVIQLHLELATGGFQVLSQIQEYMEERSNWGS